MSDKKTDAYQSLVMLAADPFKTLLLQTYDSSVRTFTERLDKKVKEARDQLDVYLTKKAEENPIFLIDRKKFDELFSVIGSCLDPEELDARYDSFFKRIEEVYSKRNISEVKKKRKFKKHKLPKPQKEGRKNSDYTESLEVLSKKPEYQSGVPNRAVAEHMGLTGKQYGSVVMQLLLAQKRGNLKDFSYDSANKMWYRK